MDAIGFGICVVLLVLGHGLSTYMLVRSVPLYRACAQSVMIGLLFCGIQWMVKQIGGAIISALQRRRRSRQMQVHGNKYDNDRIRLSLVSLILRNVAFATLCSLVKYPIVTGMIYIFMTQVLLTCKYSPFNYEVKYSKFLSIYSKFQGSTTSVPTEQHHVQHNLKRAVSLPIMGAKKSSFSSCSTIHELPTPPLSVSPTSAYGTQPWTWSHPPTSIKMKSSRVQKTSTLHKKLSTYSLQSSFANDTSSTRTSSSSSSSTSSSSGETTSLLSTTTTLYSAVGDLEANQSPPPVVANFNHFTQYYLDTCTEFPIDPYFIKFGTLMKSVNIVSFLSFFCARYLEKLTILLLYNQWRYLVPVCMIQMAFRLKPCLTTRLQALHCFISIGLTIGAILLNNL
ncbi:hypothetical protein CAAN1_11S05006 [[Candida] anglica]|uniref:Uncharacterized protein n=1 Tax=[Candida] anglica TaxID=148631 RepID=A0ABP0EHR2_9ASCO